jgi:hypothetical protein
MKMDENEVPPKFSPDLPERFSALATNEIEKGKQTLDAMNQKLDERKLALEEKKQAWLENKPQPTGGSGSSNVKFEQKQEQFDETNWPKLVKLISPLNASSRSVLGVAGTSNMRADRALSILNDPKTTVNEIKSLVDTDILGIMKGGVPDAEQLKNGLIKTFGTDALEKLQYWSSNPKEFSNPAVRQRLIEITHGLKDVDNKIINDMLGVGASAYIPMINRHPDWWEQVKKGITGTTTAASENKTVTNNLTSEDKQAIQWAKSNPNDPRAAKILQIHGM